jgi:hypothetical protein
MNTDKDNGENMGTAKEQSGKEMASWMALETVSRLNGFRW